MARSTSSAFSDQAQAAPPAAVSLAGLWQMPLLIVSLGLFTLAAYLFIDPAPGPGFREQIERARREIRNERYDAAIGRLNDLIAARPEASDEAEARLLIAEALDRGMQRSRHEETPAAHRRILRETKLATDAGAPRTAEIEDRVARSWEALGSIQNARHAWHAAIDLLEKADRAVEAVPMRRSATEMLVLHDQPTAATEELKAFLEVPGLADDERAWALGELARLSVDAGRPDEAMPLLAEALALSPDESIQGQVNFRMGYAAWKLGDRSGAEGYLSMARKQLGTGHFLDAEACYLLGRIAQEKISDEGGEAASAAAREAAGFYEIVLRDHPGSRVAPRAKLGRAVCRLVLGDAGGGAADLADAATEFTHTPGLEPLREDLVDALQRGSRVLFSHGDYARAVDLMAHEQAVAGELETDYFARLGRAFELQGNAVAEQIEQADSSERPTLEKRARGLWVHAGDAYIAYSRKLTLIDDEGYGDAMWKGIELYNRAADLAEMIAALDLFVRERPEDPIAPDAMLRLGRAYQANGQQDKAVDVFVRLRDDYPQALAAAEAAVPLAQAYVTQGRERWPLAENVLRGVVENNPVLGPESRVFQAATWELGQFYYRMERWGEALGRFEEFASRYPEDERRPQLLFLRGDCYRRAAAELEVQADEAQVRARVASTASDTVAAAAATRENEEAAQQARRYHIEAKRLFEATVALYSQEAPQTALDETYERLAWFYRADCLYDLGRYAESIDLYDAAAFRYQDDPSALSAYVQIVNAYVALGRPEDAKTANERAKWLLRRIPPESFRDGALALSRENWQQWLNFAGESGMW